MLDLKLYVLLKFKNIKIDDTELLKRFKNLKNTKYVINKIHIHEKGLLLEIYVSSETEGLEYLSVVLKEIYQKTQLHANYYSKTYKVLTKKPTLQDIRDFTWSK